MMIFIAERLSLALAPSLFFALGFLWMISSVRSIAQKDILKHGWLVCFSFWLLKSLFYYTVVGAFLDVLSLVILLTAPILWVVALYIKKTR